MIRQTATGSTGAIAGLVTGALPTKEMGVYFYAKPAAHSLGGLGKGFIVIYLFIGHIWSICSVPGQGWVLGHSPACKEFSLLHETDGVIQAEMG